MPVGRKSLVQALIVLFAVSTVVVPPLWQPAVTVTGAGGMYHVPVTITERSGQDLANYSVKIVLNSTNFPYWNNIASENGSDIYFLDVDGNPLYYWIEYFNKTGQQAIIWVKVPNIPANNNTTVFMYYGGSNPYASYNNPSRAFMFYDSFDWSFSNSGTSGTQRIDVGNGWYIYIYDKRGRNDVQWTVDVGNGTAVISSKDAVSGDGEEDVSLVYPLNVAPSNVAVEFRSKAPDWRGVGSVSWYRGFLQGLGNFSTIGGAGRSWVCLWFHGLGLLLSSANSTDHSETDDLDVLSVEQVNDYVVYRVALTGGKALAYYSLDNGLTWNLWGSKTDYLPTENLMVYFSVSAWARAGPHHLYVDWVRVRKYVDPEPSVSVGKEFSIGVRLPWNTLLFRHDIKYSPGSAQFSYSFTAGNASTAGYETGYVDPWGVRVWANPYTTLLVSNANNATLIGQVNITLPYGSVDVLNLTFYARTNGTGSYRRLWVRLLNSAGGVVAELANATMGTGWTLNTVTVNKTLSGQVTIWFNATVASTTTAGEEIGVKDVVLAVEYSTNITVRVPFVPRDFFNCSAGFTVELGNTSLVNSTTITFKIVEHLVYNTTDYPVKPVYVGNETVNGLTYRVYRIDPANYTGTYTMYVLLDNKIKDFSTRVGGYGTDTVLLGEPLTIELPVEGNITIPELNLTFINTTVVDIVFNKTGDYTIVVNRTLTSSWSVGYCRKTVHVVYGSVTVNLLDSVGRAVDYEYVVFRLLNSTAVEKAVGRKSITIDNLWAGNYTAEIWFKDTLLWRGSVELNFSNRGPVLNASLPMVSLPVDYRGFSRSVATGFGKRVLRIDDLGGAYPYSRMRILLNGSGTFRLYIDYRGDPPTKVRVAGNVTGLKYYWDGYYLVVEGSLGSVGEVNVTDLYRLRVELYDRLGNLMPSWMYSYINASMHQGPVIEDYCYPDAYTVSLPKIVNGFEFYGFFDGFNESLRLVKINHSDVVLRAWYRVPTTVELNTLKVSRFSLFSLLPFMGGDDGTVWVYVEGYLRDYYGNGVPGRPVVLNITNTNTGYTWSYNLTTDASGYFRSPIMQLSRGQTYHVTVSYNGDDVYVGTLGGTDVRPEELPSAPVSYWSPSSYLLLAMFIVLGVAVFLAVLKAVRHSIEEVRTETRRFVKEKH